MDERPTVAEVVDELKEAAEVVDACKHQRNFTEFGGSSFEVSYSYNGRCTSVKKAMQQWYVKHQLATVWYSSSRLVSITVYNYVPSLYGFMHCEVGKV